MKRIIPLIIGFLMLIIFPGIHAGAQSTAGKTFDEIKLELARGIRTILIKDQDKGFQSIRGAQISKEEDGTTVYEVKDLKFSMYAESQYILTRAGSPMGFYMATYKGDATKLAASFQAFKEMNDPMTVEKSIEMSKDGKIVYIMYFMGLKNAIYTMDEAKAEGAMIIGFLD